VWFDYDNDGRLDLFVCRFGDFDRSKNNSGATRKQENVSIAFRALTPSGKLAIHQNNGDGTFTDVSRESASTRRSGKAWVSSLRTSTMMADDLFVANDTVPNFLS